MSPVALVIGRRHEPIDIGDRRTFRGTVRCRKNAEGRSSAFYRNVISACDTTSGSLRKAIRLCENLRLELNSLGQAKSLHSADVTSLLYWADRKELALGFVYDLMILAEAQRFFQRLCGDHALARSLKTPDLCSYIIDDDEKLSDLGLLSQELDKLTADVASEYDPSLRQESTVDGPRLRSILSRVSMPD